jgi:hypothetical protein
MVSPVSPPQVRAHPEVQPPAARPPAKPQPAATDTVKISVAAQALQEATETQAQTTKEAGSGDVQARRLLAQEAAAGAVTKEFIEVSIESDPSEVCMDHRVFGGSRDAWPFVGFHQQGDSAFLSACFSGRCLISNRLEIYR